MNQGKWDWEEGLALGLLNEVGSPDVVDAFELARACGLAVHFGSPPRIELQRGLIFVSRRAPPPAQHWQVAHEIGHWLLARSAELQNEHSADIIAMALLVPRAAGLRAVREAGDIAAAVERFPNCPPEIASRRLRLLRDGASF